MSIETRLRQTGNLGGGGGGGSSNSAGLAGTGGLYVVSSASPLLPNSRILTAGSSVTVVTDGTAIYVTAITSGATSPGGANNQIQFNSGGATFAGTASFAFIQTSNVLVFAGTARSISALQDSTANNILVFTGTNSSVNYFSILNHITGSNPTISATGSDTDIGINLTPKGVRGITVGGTFPTSPAIGDFGYDTTDRVFKVGEHSGPGRLVKISSTNIANATEVGNTASETNFSTDFIFPSTSITVGRHFRVLGLGIYSSEATTAGNVILALKMAGTTILTTSNVTLTNNVSNKPWYFEGFVTCRQTGTPGNVMANGKSDIDDGTLDTTILASNLSAQSIDTNTAQLIQISAKFSVAATANKITLQNFIITG